jgi:catechol 2,3-dioxygenase-like lactoylglutathione lyase family enzyme
LVKHGPRGGPQEETMDKISGVKSINLTSDQPEATARFYREVLELPLEPERHRGTEPHWAGQIGPLHFAVHPRAGFWLPTSAGGADTIVSFTAALEPFEARFAAHGVPIVARNRIGPMSFIAVRDPDGRHVCIGTPWPERGPRATP